MQEGTNSVVILLGVQWTLWQYSKLCGRAGDLKIDQTSSHPRELIVLRDNAVFVVCREVDINQSYTTSL